METDTTRNADQLREDRQTPPATEQAPRARGAALPDPDAFFKHESGDNRRAALTHDRAQQTAPATLVMQWARAVHAQTALWSVITIATAAAMLWSGAPHAAWSRSSLEDLLLLAVGAILVTFGVNLVHTTSATTLPGALTQSRAAQIGVALFVVGTIIGAVGVRGSASGGMLWAGLGIVGAAGYALAPLANRHLPGLELLPAVLVGPLLYGVALLAAHRAHFAVSNGTWMVALALGSFYAARQCAASLATAVGTGRQTLRDIVGERNLRLLFVLALVAAYGLVVLAGVGHHLTHGVLAVLLSLPIAILPLSGALLAQQSAALGVLTRQTQRALVVFGAWLICGLLLGGLYMRFLGSLHVLHSIK